MLRVCRLIAGNPGGTGTYKYIEDLIARPLASPASKRLIVFGPDMRKTEELMKRTLIAGVTALSLIGASMSFAQAPAPEAQMHEHHHFSQADMKAFTDARIAALKAGLELTPDQEKDWAPVDLALRSFFEARRTRWAEFREHAKTEDAIARLRARADAMTQTAAELKKVADAAEPLYRKLSDDQKKRLHVLVGMMMHHGHHHHGDWQHHT